MNNPLLQTFDEAPFRQIENKHYHEAFIEAIKLAKEEISQIVENPEQPSFENTIESLEYSGEQLSRISSIFFNLNSAETNDEIQQIANEISPLLSEFGNDITLNEALFTRVKAVYEQKDVLELNEEQTTLLEKHYKSFTRNGALLSEEDKVKLREIDKDLSAKSLKFGQNLLADTNNYFLHITDELDLKGLPENVKEAAKAQAVSKEKEGWVFTLDYPSYVPFMQYADNRDLRKELSLAFGQRAFKDNDYNNEHLIKEIVTLRQQRANLLGFDSHAHFVLEERMAQSAENVNLFLEDLLQKAKPAAQKEFDRLSQFAKEIDGIEVLEKWDASYYTEKLKQKLFNFSEELLKPYFQLDASLKGVFEISNRLFGLSFAENTEVEVYHDDVKVYDVTDDKGNFVALLYTDFHPRPGKRAGAWMTSYKSQKVQNGKDHRPHVSIVCNFTPATESTPSLLTFNELTTLFHEFGHALHGMLARTTYPSLSGTSVFWDFVELPSQILENWCYEKEALMLFAYHYQTQDLIPMEYIDNIKATASFQEGIATLRQLSFGMLDMAWHNAPDHENYSVKEFEKMAFGSTQLYPDVSQNIMSTSFSHIFQGGYASGYYSYKWAEVLDADAFSIFQQAGIFDKETATRFKTEILEKGGIVHPEKLYLNFAKRKPTNNALLKRAGLI